MFSKIFNNLGGQLKARSLACFRTLLVVGLVSVSLQSGAQQTWYTLASGNWNDKAIWTLDPAGALPINPSGQIPSSDKDKIVIKNGKTVVVTTQPAPSTAPLVLNCGELTVDGTLDLKTSSGHNFTKIKGSGRILMAGDNFPLGDATHFTSKDQGGGTAVFYGNANISLTNDRTFCNLEVQMDAGKVLSVTSNVTVNGNLTIISGDFRFGDATATKRQVTVQGDVKVEATGNISVGSGKTYSTTPSVAYPVNGYHSIFHQFVVYGNFTNRGNVRLTNESAPRYNALTELGAVTLRFEGESNSRFYCEGTTDLYNLVVNKGTDRSYQLELSVSAADKFRLFGSNNESSKQNGNFTITDPEVWKALYIRAGTLRLTGAISIPTLSEGGEDFIIGAKARLWIDGSNVKVYTTASATGQIDGFTSSAIGVNTGSGSQALTVLGELKVTNGYLGSRNSAGLIFRASSSAQVTLEGGVVDVAQFRSASSSSGRSSLMQSGGLLLIRGSRADNFGKTGGELSGDPIFQMANENDVFVMSGGEIRITHFSSAPSDISLPCADGNYQVTGGKVSLQLVGDDSFGISSNVNFHDLEISRTSGTKNVVVTLNPYTLDNGVTFGNYLTIGNHLTVKVGTELNANAKDLNVGGNFVVDGKFTHGNNTTKFIGSNPSKIINSTEVKFNNFVVAKQHQYSGFVPVEFNGTGNAIIEKDLLITEGYLNTSTRELTVNGNIEIEEGGIENSTGNILLSGSSQQTIKGSLATEQAFGRLKLNNDKGLMLLSNVNMTSLEFAKDAIVDLGEYNLTLQTANYTDATGEGWGPTRMFRTNGLSSDGGLTLPVLPKSYSNDQLAQFFPVGVPNNNKNRFTAGKVLARNAITTNGTVTMKPVAKYHPSVPNEKYALEYYWSAVAEGFSDTDKSNIKYDFSYDQNIVVDQYCVRVPFIGDVCSDPKAMVFTGQRWEEGKGSKLEKTLSFNYDAPLSKDYTYSVPGSAWGLTMPDPRTLYSIADGNFNSRDTWSENGHEGGRTSDAPRSYDILIIGGTALVNHTVTMDVDGCKASQIIIRGKSEISNNAVNPPTLVVNSGTNKHVVDEIKGNGRILYKTTTLISGNHTQLCDSPEAIFEYQLGSDNLPNSIAYYPNLVINSSASNIIISAESKNKLLVKNNLTVNSGSNGLVFNLKKHTDVWGSLQVGNGKLMLPNDNPISVRVSGDLVLDHANAGLSIVADGNKVQMHSLYLKGNLLQNNGFINLNDPKSKCDFFLEGQEDARFVKTNGITKFYRVNINKPVIKTFHFNSGFTLGAPTNEAIKPLTLTSGIANLNSSGIDITLSSGGGDFNIPSTSELVVANGASVKLDGANTGVRLDGKMTINQGGQALLEGNSGNYVEYTASGLSTITINGNGKLRVGSQIRRSVNNEAGILKFAQNSADSKVTIGTNTADAETSRGVFEILNPGSSFTQAAGATISIMNGQNASAFADFYFDPATVSLGAGSTIAFSGGNATNPVEIYAAKPLQNVLVNNLAQVALKTLPLTVLGDLTIGNSLPTDVNQYANFDARTLELTLYGDITNNGNYKKTNNITRFKGERDQTIWAGAAIGFPYFVKEGNRTITVKSLKADGSAIDVNITRNMQMDGGTIILGKNNWYLKGDANITGKILYKETLAESETFPTLIGVRFNGTENQTLSGALEADVVTIENAQGVLVPTQASAIKVNRALNMNGGIFDIGKNLLELGVNAAVVAQKSFDKSNMIQTNVSFADAGVRKVFPAGPSTFTYPVGAMGKYTPVVFDIAANGNATGSIRIRPANEPHPTILGTTSGVNNADNVLQYHWVVDAAGISGFSANLKFNAQAADEKKTMPGKTFADYVPARLNANAKWILGTEQEYDETNHCLDLNFTNRGDFDIDGDYTAGLQMCIPNVQQYVSIKDGNWNDKTVWATVPAGGTVPDSGPRGSIVTINHKVTVPGNGISAYRTVLNQTGRLDLGNTFAHRLGTVSGNGTLASSKGDLPAAVYDAFFGSAGGTLEYYGDQPISILSELPALNHLALKGIGTKSFPNGNVLLYGNLTIDNAVVAHPSGKVLNVKGDVTISGTSTYNAGSSTLVLSGSKKQVITGDFTSTKNSKLYNLMVSNIYGVDLKNAVDVDNKLMLSSGVISTKAAGASLTLLNSSPTDVVTGGGTSSYVEGFLRKYVTSGSYFDFPVGDKTRYGKVGVYNVSKTDYYQARYYNQDPNPTYPVGTSEVSRNEYWQIAAAAGTAKVALRYDNNSGINPADVKIAAWVSPAWQDASNGAALATAGSQFLSTPNLQTLSNGIFTFAGTMPSTQYNWTGDAGTKDWFTPGNWASGKVPDASTNVVIDNTTKPAEIGSIVHPAECNNLTINAGCSLTLAPGSKFQVNGTTTVNGDLILNQDVTNPCSFIHEGAVTGNVIVAVTYPADNRNWYMGHAVKTNINAYNSTSFQVWRYGHLATSESWIEEKDFAVSKPLEKPMEGFVVYKKADAGNKVSVSHKGELYQGDQSFTLDVDAKYRWNLVANPYPAYVDPRAIGAIDYSNIESHVWFRTKIGKDHTFTTFNVAENISTNTDPANPDNLIAPMQAFWVRAKADGAFIIGKNARVHPSASNPMLKSAGTKVSDVLFLQLNNDVSSDEMAVACRLVGSTFYTSIDSDKRLMGGSIPNVYSLKNNKAVTINIQPEEPDTAGIALGFAVTAEANKSLHLVARNIDSFMPGMSVYLEDRTTGARIDLRANPEYAFTSDPKTDNSRFVLKFEKISTGVDDEVVAEQKGERIRIFGQKGKAIVLVGSELLRQGPARVNIYNLAGSLMSTKEVSDTRSELTLPAAPGIYLVEAEAGGQVKREKVVK